MPHVASFPALPLSIRPLHVVLAVAVLLLVAGCGDGTARDRAREVADLTEFEVPRGPDLAPRKLAFASDATIGAKDDGSVWGWGVSAHGELATKAQGALQTTPTRLDGLSDIVEVAGGAGHFIALGRDGGVYAWGSNEYGQLGYAEEGDYSSIPRKVPGLENIVSIGADRSRSVALDDAGRIYGFGLSERGVFGVSGSAGESGKSQAVPVLIDEIPGAVKVFVGSTSIAVLTAGGVVWFIGSNLQGKIGCAAGAEPWISKFTKCGGISVVSIALGNATTYLLDNHGKVHAIGFNSGGQLGQGYRDAKINSRLASVPGIGRIVAIASSGPAAYATDDRGRLWSWGESAGGPSIAGFARKDWPSVGFVAQLESPVAVVGGHARGAALLADGRTVFFGRALGAVRGTGRTMDKDTEQTWLTPEASLWRWK